MAGNDAHPGGKLGVSRLRGGGRAGRGGCGRVPAGCDAGGLPAQIAPAVAALPLQGFGSGGGGGGARQFHGPAGGDCRGAGRGTWRRREGGWRDGGRGAGGGVAGIWGGRALWVACTARTGRVFLSRDGVVESFAEDDLPVASGRIAVGGGCGQCGGGGAGGPGVGRDADQRAGGGAGASGGGGGGSGGGGICRLWTRCRCMWTRRRRNCPRAGCGRRLGERVPRGARACFCAGFDPGGGVSGGARRGVRPWSRPSLARRACSRCVDEAGGMIVVRVAADEAEILTLGVAAGGSAGRGGHGVGARGVRDGGGAWGRGSCFWRFSARNAAARGFV